MLGGAGCALHVFDVEEFATICRPHLQVVDMENYTFAELTEFYLMGQAGMDTQFYYWVTVTFAAVVAGFVAGDRLTWRLRIVIAILYLLASSALVIRFVTSARAIADIRSFLQDAGALITEPYNLYLVLLRAPLLILGTAAALFFLLRPQTAGYRQRDGK